MEKPIQRYRVRQRYVAFCDVLGFKDMIETQSLLSLTQKYDALLSEASKVTLRKRIYPSATPWKPKYYHSKHIVFSDSILVWSASPTIHSYSYGNDFFVMLSIFFALAMTKGFPLRIGVAFGPCVIAPKEGIYLGQPIIDAYRTEGIQDWIGVACHSTCLNAPFSHNLRMRGPDGRCVGPLIEYEVPIKANVKDHSLKWTIDWPFWGFPCRVKNTLTVLHRQYLGTPFADRWDRALQYYSHRRSGWGEELDLYAESHESQLRSRGQIRK